MLDLPVCGYLARCGRSRGPGHRLVDQLQGNGVHLSSASRVLAHEGMVRKMALLSGVPPFEFRLAALSECHSANGRRWRRSLSWGHADWGEEVKAVIGVLPARDEPSVVGLR